MSPTIGVANINSPILCIPTMPFVAVSHCSSFFSSLLSRCFVSFSSIFLFHHIMYRW